MAAVALLPPNQTPLDMSAQQQTQPQLQLRQGKAFDFTKRKRWAETLVDELPGVVMLVCDSSANVIFCGNASRELLNWNDSVQGSKLEDYIHPDDSKPFLDRFQACIQDGHDAPAASSELLIYVRLKSFFPYSEGSGSDPKSQWPLYEIKGHPHFTPQPASNLPSSSTSVSTMPKPQCKCFFLMARPYPTYGSAALDGFLELKLEQERLTYVLNELRESDAAAGPSREPLSITTSFAVNPVHHQLGGEEGKTYYGTLSAGPPPSSATLTSSSYASLFPHRSPIAGYRDVAPSSAFSDQPAALLRARRNTVPGGDAMGGIAGIMGTDEPSTEENGKGKKKRKSMAGNDRRVCMSCGRTDSPEWRKGPLGPKTLCNACGLRHSKKAKKSAEDEVKEDDEAQQQQQDAEQQHLASYGSHTNLAPPPPQHSSSTTNQQQPSPYLQSLGGSSSSLSSFNRHPPPPPLPQPPRPVFYPVSMPMDVSVMVSTAGQPPISPSPTYGNGLQHHVHHSHQSHTQHQNYHQQQNVPPIQTQYTYPNTSGGQIQPSPSHLGYAQQQQQQQQQQDSASASASGSKSSSSSSDQQQQQQQHHLHSRY